MAETGERRYRDAWGSECAEPETCWECNGAGLSYNETCLTCGGQGKVCRTDESLQDEPAPTPREPGG